MKEQNAPTSYYVFSTLVVLALTIVSVIPASMAFRLRIFDAFGLPQWISEIVRFLILIATPTAVLVTGLVRVYGVSDTEHAKAMLTAAILEGMACVLEIIAALVNGNDIWALIGQAITMGGSIALVFGALVMTITANGFYRLAIAERERTLSWNAEYNKLFAQTMQSDEVQAEMLKAVIFRVHDETERQSGRRIYSRPGVQISGNGNGNRHSPQMQFNTEVETPIQKPIRAQKQVSGNGNGNGAEHPNRQMPGA